MTHCPACAACFPAVSDSGDSERCECGFPIAEFETLSLDVSSLDASDVDQGQRPAIEFQNAAATISVDRKSVIGRGEDVVDGWSMQTIRHRDLDEQHVAILISDEARVWVARLASESNDSSAGVFVDGCCVAASELGNESVLQIGSLAWRLDLGRQALIPVTPIAGFDLPVDAEVEGRLKRTQLRLIGGQMTALVGQSGCGKSTLLETIRDGSGLGDFESSVSKPSVVSSPGSGSPGSGSPGSGSPGSGVPSEFEIAGHVYFVPQEDLVHSDLRLGDALEAIGKFYGRQVLPFEIDAALDSVGLPTSAKSKFPRELSGGQLRRFRIAGALLSGAGVIVLDEPDSGLDHETADEVISLLHSLALRGATIVAVTHHRHVLRYFDRVITLRPTPEGGAVESDSQSVSVTTNNSVPESSSRIRHLTTLIRRERQKLTSPKVAAFSIGAFAIPHCIVGFALVPLMFAAAVAISVPTDPDRSVVDGLYGDIAPIARLGFLAVISVIWMSASQSHLSITRDRLLYDYERSYGITWGKLLTAKSLVMVAAGLLQTAVFAVLLYGVRLMWLDRSFFVDQEWTQLPAVGLCLGCVSVAATMLGLLISTVAGRAPLMATAVLPVVMMFQILFSAPFAVSNPDGYEPLADYQQLTVFSDEESLGEEADDGWEDDWGDDDLDRARPLRVTSLVSYGTLSRYGDQWIRASAVTTDEVEQGRAVQIRAAIALLGIAFGCFGLSWATLWMQTSRLGKRREAKEFVSDVA